MCFLQQEDTMQKNTHSVRDCFKGHVLEAKMHHSTKCPFLLLLLQKTQIAASRTLQHVLYLAPVQPPDPRGPESPLSLPTPSVITRSKASASSGGGGGLDWRCVGCRAERCRRCEVCVRGGGGGVRACSGCVWMVCDVFEATVCVCV